MSKFAQGLFNIKNKAKYVGNGAPRYRSSWEFAFMQFCDNNDHIINWASEPVRIPYRHPITGKMTTYVPDFIITYRTKDSSVKAELIEIKPRSQSVVEGRMNDGQKAVVAVNYCKWDAASKWAQRNGLSFRVINEDQIFHQGSKTSKPKVAKPRSTVRRTARRK